MVESARKHGPFDDRHESTHLAVAGPSAAVLTWESEGGASAERPAG
jgi:hypothetical protein